MKTREYLINLGLAKPGSRGRISKEATAALVKAKAEGIIFDSPTEKPTSRAKKEATRKQTAATATKHVAVRKQKVIWGWDKSVRAAICFESCAGCSKPIRFCTHEVPLLPSWLDSSPYWKKPEFF